VAEIAYAAEITALLDRLSARMRARDPAIIELFADDDTTLLVGSEPDEIARGRAAIGTLFATIFASTSAVHWEWTTVDATGVADLAWFFAEGSVVIAGAEETVWRAYRLGGVLIRHGGAWRFAQFHGSEPMIG
jgi:hypothetical protein